MSISADVVVVIVGFRNPDDVADCLRALAYSYPEPRFDVFIAENGGAAAVDALGAVLAADGGPCRTEASDMLWYPDAPWRCRRFRLMSPTRDPTPARRVIVAEMPENLGYAGAVNAWLRELLPTPGWEGVWILNPDTEPTPSALAELVACARTRGKGMIGSRLIPIAGSDRIHSRGLAWRKLTARTVAVDYRAIADADPDVDDIEQRLDAPSGASLYVTRDLIRRIGLMDERYFLYFEDLDWGSRAKAVHAIGYAHRSVVPHKGGTTVRSTGCRAARSRLAVYLEFRNPIIFVRTTYPAWLAWTVVMQVVHAARFALGGARANFRAAVQGLIAGLQGELGRPDRILDDGGDKARPPAPGTIGRGCSSE